MGIQESKSGLGSSLSTSTGSLRRSSLYKSGTIDEIQAKHELIRSVKSDIDIFAGSRTDVRYKDLQHILVKASTDLEQLKRKANKERTRDRCDQVQAEVQDCFQRLEAKLVSNDQSDRGLDLASVETDSFTNHSFNNIVPPNRKYVKPEHVKSLDDIEFQIQNLEKEVKLAIDLEETKQFIILEKKITILYGDLVMVQIDDHTPLSERREALERRLISCNNEIKKCKRRLTKRLSDTSQITLSKADSTDIEKIQKHLSDMEIEALTFEGVRYDKRYKELEQILERYWTKLYALDLFTDNERYKRDLTVEKAKKILQQLVKRADENEQRINTNQALLNIEQQTEALYKEVEEFKGASTDTEYTKLDQDARKLWANINEIEDVSEHVKNAKSKAILNIQNIIKELSQKTKRRESQTLEDVQHKQLLDQVNEFNNHWNQLNHILSERSTIDSNISATVVEILETILDGLRKKTRALSVIENRKSNASLVVTKLTDGSELYVKYKSAPDLVPQRLGIPEEVDVKAPPPQKNKVIAEMHRLGNEAKNLLQQIKHTNINNENKKLYEIKLSECRTSLAALEYNKKSDTIESNRRRVTKILDEGFKVLSEIPTNEQTRSTTALEIMDVDAEIYYWRQQIKTFSGTVKDKQYEKIKNGLAESLIKLQVLGDKHISKQDSIQQIQQHHQELESRLAENQARVKCAEIKRRTSQELKTTVEQVQRLRAQVDRFSGAYQGILYKQIEGNLKACNDKLIPLDTKNEERLLNAKTQTQQKIQKYLTILEDKAAKPDKQPSPKVEQYQKPHDSQVLKETSTYQRVFSQDLSKEKQQPQQPTVATTDVQLPHHKINALRDYLVVVKQKVEAFSGQYKGEEYLALWKDIQECLDRLKAIDDDGHQSVVTSKAQYVNYIEQLQEYFEEKTLAVESSGVLQGADEV